MKIKIIYFGKNKHQYITDAINDYKKLLNKHVSLEIIELKDEPVLKKDPQKTLKLEAEKILKYLSSQDFTIILDQKGKEYSSEGFSNFLSKNIDQGKNITFMIGSALGFDNSIKAIADLRLSLSKMTLTHQLSRILLLEQVFRGFEIIKGTEYHK